METLEEVLPSAEEQGEQEEEIAMEKEEMEEKEEEIEEKEEEIEEKEEADDAAIKDDAADGLQKEEKEEGGGKEQGGGGEPEVKAIPKPADKIAAKKKKNPFPNKPKEKKPDEGLNLNNEVVRMRKEVKRVRALIIRKLMRQSGALKKKKGKEAEVESNLRRAGRLLEEIQAMKTLSPDLVSKTALQKNLHFEQVCKNPKSTASDRAIARIATHPQFNKKIEDLKAAVKAFKEERMKAEKQEEEEKAQIKGGKVTPQSPHQKGERETEEGGVAVEQKELLDDEEEEEEEEDDDDDDDDDLLEDTEDAAAAEPEKETGKASPADGRRREMPEARNVRLVSVKGSGVKDVVRNKPQAEKKPDLKSAPEVLQKKRDEEEEEESDLESDDEEKDKPQTGQPEKKPDVLEKKMDEEEEEEESDLESDGEKDKPQAEKKPDHKSVPEVLQKKMDEEEESDLESGGEEKGKPEAKQAEKKPDMLQKNRCEEEESDLESDGEEEDKPEAKQAEKKPDLKSAPGVLQKKMDGEEEESDLEPAGEEKEYFDDSTEERFLKQSSQSEESDDGFFVGKVNRCKKKKTKKKTKKSGEGDAASTWREGAGTDKFQGELDELESRLKSKGKSFQSVFCSSLSSSKPGGGRGRGGDGFGGRGRPRGGGGRDGDFSRQPRFQKQERDSFPSGGRGRGRGRGDGMRQNDRRGGGGGFTQQAPEQALHPSWEASKKRKEQQGQILAFQGKKIKFDMDD